MIESQEFLSFFKRLAQEPKGWILHFSISSLSQNLSPNKVGLFLRTLEGFEKEKRTQLFQKKNDVFLYFGENKYDELDALLIKVQFTLGWTLLPKEKKNTYRIYHLTEEWENFKKLLLSDNTPKAPPSFLTNANKVRTVAPTATLPNISLPFTPTILSQIEKALTHTDLSAMTKRQPVCALVGKAPPVELFEEIYISLSDLKKTLCPQVNLFEAPWLMARLLETLDKCVLENITHHDAGAFVRNFSLNLTLQTVCSTTFDAFDKTISNENKESILIEFKLEDAVAHIQDFLKASIKLKDKGYRICLDGVTTKTLPLLLASKMNIDFIKIIYTDDFETSTQSDVFKQALHSIERSRFILCRVDNKRAIEIGSQLGIFIYQGYYIQKLLYQNPKSFKE